MKKSHKKTAIPTYTEVKGSEWLKLQTALRMLADDPKDRNGELNAMRQKVIRSNEKDGIPVLNRDTGTIRVITAEFFQWAYSVWPHKCQRLNVTPTGTAELGFFSSTLSSRGLTDPPEDLEALKQCYREAQLKIFELQEKIEALEAQIADLKPDAERSRKKRRDGKKTGSKRGAWDSLAG